MFSLLEYCKYLFRSFHLHGIHSPFVFSFVQLILREKYAYYAFKDIESIRAKLLLTEQEINVLDLGAGSKKSKAKKRKINTIAKSAAKSPKYAQLLFRIVNESQANHILEFGTSLGISTAYLALANKKAKIISMEGSPELAKIAAINLEKLEASNARILTGEFESNLNHALSELQKLDLVFFDGNHQEKATINYFETCLEYAHEDSIFIFDDIYWSPGMKKAWHRIKNHPKVTISIDIFQMGIVYFKKDRAKENFTVYH